MNAARSTGRRGWGGLPRQGYVARGVIVALFLCAVGICCRTVRREAARIQRDPRWQLDHGGIVRGDTATRSIALIFTGGDFGEGCEHILATLARFRVQASFFLTGAFLSRPEHSPFLERMRAEGHYVGPHSQAHLLYCPWEDRSRSLVSREEFQADLQENIERLQETGALARRGPIFFIPPYEWYNERHVRWANEMGVVLFNFTPGSGSHRDWIPEGEKGFVPATTIVEDILAYEQRDPHGLNGFLLLLHLGAQRQDKVYLHLHLLLEELLRRGYHLVRVDQLLAAN